MDGFKDFTSQLVHKIKQQFRRGVCKEASFNESIKSKIDLTPRRLSPHKLRPFKKLFIPFLPLTKYLNNMHRKKSQKFARLLRQVIAKNSRSSGDLKDEIKKFGEYLRAQLLLFAFFRYVIICLLRCNFIRFLWLKQNVNHFVLTV